MFLLLGIEVAPPGQVHSRQLCALDLQMKHRFSSTGNPSCMKWHEIPLEHSPAFQKVQGLAQLLMVLETLAAVPAGVEGACGAAAGGALAPAVAAAALAAAALFSFSLICTLRARWLSVNGGPGLSDGPPSKTSADSSRSANSETSWKAAAVMT